MIFQSSIGANFSFFFCHVCFQFHFLRRVLVQYANVLFFKKCYCTVNIIVNIFIPSVMFARWSLVVQPKSSQIELHNQLSCLFVLRKRLISYSLLFSSLCFVPFHLLTMIVLHLRSVLRLCFEAVLSSRIRCIEQKSWISVFGLSSGGALTRAGF